MGYPLVRSSTPPRTCVITTRWTTLHLYALLCAPSHVRAPATASASASDTAIVLRLASEDSSTHLVSHTRSSRLVFPSVYRVSSPLGLPFSILLIWL